MTCQLESSDKAEKSAEVLGSAKASQAFFPSVEVIQAIPVSSTSPVEGPDSSLQGQPKVDDVCDQKFQFDAFEGAGPCPTGAREKSPPFMLELFCGTAGVCAQFRLKGGRGAWHRPPFETCEAEGSRSLARPHPALGSGAHRDGGHARQS